MNGRILVFDGSFGISGDMTVGALLGLGASRAKLDSALASLRLDGLSYSVSESASYGIAGVDFDVSFFGDTDHGHHVQDHDHSGHDAHNRHDGHDDHEHHHHEHRDLHDVCAIIDRAEMADSARALAKKIFRIVAEAEAKAHGRPVGEVHFHEVGAIDSIADIVSAAVLLDDLAPDSVVCGPLSEGTGTVACAHGDLPVPVPAVLNIAEAHGIAIRPTATQGEMVTPTGIAIVAATRTASALADRPYRVLKTGVGLGKRDFGRPNFLRAMIVALDDSPSSCDSSRIFVVETNIDDSTGEELGLAMERLFAAGALDVRYTPCFSKKNRPAWLLSAIAPAAAVPAVERAVFANTTSIGVREYPVSRTCMARECFDVPTSAGAVRVKRCSFEGLVRFYPEYESVKAAAEKSALSYREVYTLAQEAAERNAKG